MNDLEDEPQDVQDATPVEDEIKEGEVDKVKEKPEPEPISEDEFEEEEEESEDDCANPCKRRKLKKIPSPFMCKNPVIHTHYLFIYNHLMLYLRTRIHLEFFF